jgi:class 3 adenylate cyclase
VRYLKVTILIGFLTALLVAVMFEVGVFRAADLRLGSFLGLRFSPISGRVEQYPFFVFFSFAIAWTTIDILKNSLKSVIALLAMVELIAAVWVCDKLGIFFSPFASGVAIIVAFAVAFLYSQSDAGGRKRVVRTIFGDRISGRNFSTLINSDVPLNFDGELREGTVVVCEIFNHDELADALPVADYVALNNSFLRNAAEILVERGGYLDECDGESLRVIFGVPLVDTHHAAVACEAALDVMNRLDEVNRECYRVWSQTFDFRIGINSGEMVVAAYGSGRLGSFSVAGEAVEWARKLCSANIIYGSRLLIGSYTFQLTETSMEVRPMDFVHRHPNDHGHEEIYELLARKQTLSDEDLLRRELFWKGILYFREAKWDQAIEQLRLAAAGDSSDGPIEFYLRRIDQLRNGVPLLEGTYGRI